MATITEDYVSFETAKLLKEKGFKGFTMFSYSTRGTTMCGHWENETDWLPKCTLQMAMKWLREVHNCPIEILWHWNANSQCSEWYFGHHMELKPLPQIQYYDAYEEACEAAIKYCLKVLI